MRRGRSSKAAAAETTPHDEMFDEVDDFHEQRDVARFGGGEEERQTRREAREATWADAASDTEQVMAIDVEREAADDVGFAEEHFPADHLGTADGAAVEEAAAAVSRGPLRLNPASRHWGQKKAVYYMQQRATVDNDEDMAQEEEQEALRMQRSQFASLKPEDFDDSLGALAAKKETGTVKKGADAQMLESLNAALDSTPLQEGDDAARHDVASLTPEQRQQLLMRDAPELMLLVSDFKSSVAVMRGLEPILRRIGSQNLSKAASFLRLHYTILQQYSMNIAFYFSMKSQGADVKDHPVIAELVSIRGLLEQMKKLEEKLKPQLAQLLSGKVSPSAPRRHVGETKDKDELEGEGEGEGTTACARRKRRRNRKKQQAAQGSPSAVLGGAAVAATATAGRVAAAAVAVAKAAPAPAKLAHFAEDDETEETAEARQREMRQAINALNIPSEKRQTRSADTDLPYKEQPSRKRLADEQEEEQVEEEEAEEEKEIAGPTVVTKAKEADEATEGAKRAASAKIAKNAPATQHKARTSHTRLRNKFTDKVKRMHGMRPKMRDRNKPYEGEQTGIKAAVVKSARWT
eukprot:TRINITY_DN3689_c2_g1_i3.p1 TRINITY_DN3689_c2_g1~~TRINITY_DN3689_c2_g1_i3.p1  ORF type:complete len:586 (-),score=210.43 TRINITY_DN3689_c2_g1_i3:25-1758(-)